MPPRVWLRSVTSAVAVVLIVALAGALGLSAGPADRAAAQSSPPCELVLGFRAFHDELGADITGECIENQQSTRAGAAQRTTRGLLEWDAATNRVSFTDGYYTWASTVPNGEVMVLPAAPYRPYKEKAEYLKR